ncbi:hypothetical protein ACC754_41385, partial [Rhizobium johnstonii]
LPVMIGNDLVEITIVLCIVNSNIARTALEHIGDRQWLIDAAADNTASVGHTLLIADEPTTELDVTIQAQIVDLVKDLRTKLGMS